MRGATKAEVQKAMNVKGREFTGGTLHYISNYSRGERWGDGDANFTFDAAGHVTILAASLDSPGMKNGSKEFIWNAELLPNGCSDLPGSKIQSCDALNIMRNHG